jgi:hypothetical protein
LPHVVELPSVWIYSCDFLNDGDDDEPADRDSDADDERK